MLIVDDEPIARRILREELASHESVEVAGESETGTAALTDIASLRPDVILLDIQMPQMGGFEVIQRLSGRSYIPIVIVVTAYDQHAIRAFEEGAIDYLLKPVAPPRLLKAMDRARRLLESRAEAAKELARLQEVASVPGVPALRKIVGRANNEYVLLNASEVLAFQAEGELVWIFTAEQRYLADQSLRKIEAKLEGSTFRRVRRNVLINVDHVRKLVAVSSKRWLITLNNNQEFIVSKRLARHVRGLLDW